MTNIQAQQIEIPWQVTTLVQSSDKSINLNYKTTQIKIQILNPNNFNQVFFCNMEVTWILLVMKGNTWSDAL